MASIESTPEAVQQFVAETPPGEPIVMLNLLRYSDWAKYAADADAEACSGREAYARYGSAVFPLIGRTGGRILFAGPVQNTLIAPEGEVWDDMVLVEYPSPEAFVEMTSSSAYQAISFHRTAALADSRLIAASVAAGLFAD